MGNWKSTGPIAIALVIALAGSLFLYRWIEGQKRGQDIKMVKKSEEIASIVVAKVDLPWGTKITPEMVTTHSYLKSNITKGHFIHLKDVEGRVLTASLKQGDPVVEHRLAPVSVENGGISSIVSPGKRAIAVKGDKVIGLSGFINPGNRVDVLVTIKDPRNKAEKTKAVLENILVLASGTKMFENDNGEPSPVDVYTLEVTPEEGEKLSLAATKGKLNFMLRSASDYENIRTKGVTIPQMLASITPTDNSASGMYTSPSPKKIKKTVQRKRQKQKSGTVVEVIKGLTLSKEKL